MTIFFDAAGFKYFGDCQWGTLNIDYPTQYYFEATPTHVVNAGKPGISASLTNLCTQAGLLFRNVLPQAEFDARMGTINTLGNIISFGAAGDIDDRYSFGAGRTDGGQGSQNFVQFYNDSGSTNLLSTVNESLTNRLAVLAANSRASFGVASATASPVHWCGASDGTYLALFLYRRNWAANTANSGFFYAGLLDEVNTNFNYYNANNISRSILLNSMDVTTIAGSVFGAHYLASAQKATLQYIRRNWHGITAQGTNLYAAVFGGDIYKKTSTDKTLVALGQTSRNWTSMTTLGTDVYACVAAGDIYKQTNGTGAFVALGQTSRNWTSMTTLGTDVYACVADGDIYKQTNGTGAFVALGQTAQGWRGMTVFNGDVYATSALSGGLQGEIFKQTGGVGNFVVGQFTPAQYPIVCADSQSPTSQWATDAYIFDDNNALQYPAMGIARGMLLATGTYTLGKPVKIQGSVFPDGVNAWYLPVGTYASKTLLMRCYSSMA